MMIAGRDYGVRIMVNYLTRRVGQVMVAGRSVVRERRSRLDAIKPKAVPAPAEQPRKPAA